MSEYEVLPVSEEDSDEIMRLLARTFFIDEPLNKAIGLCESSPCIEVEEYCKHTLLKGLSFKAEDREGNIIGVMISAISRLEEKEKDNLLNEAERCKNPKFQKILYILSRREEGSKLWEKFPEDEELVDVKIAATHPAWRQKGIMNVLLEKTEHATYQRGIRLLRMDTSSAYSAKSAERLGFTCVYKAAYADIKMDGRPLIVPEPPHVDDRVYIKQI